MHPCAADRVYIRCCDCDAAAVAATAAAAAAAGRGACTWKSPAAAAAVMLHQVGASDGPDLAGPETEPQLLTSQSFDLQPQSQRFSYCTSFIAYLQFQLHFSLHATRATSQGPPPLSTACSPALAAAAVARYSKHLIIQHTRYLGVSILRHHKLGRPVYATLLARSTEQLSDPTPNTWRSQLAAHSFSPQKSPLSLVPH